MLAKILYISLYAPRHEARKTQLNRKRHHRDGCRGNRARPPSTQHNWLRRMITLEECDNNACMHYAFFHV